MKVTLDMSAHTYAAVNRLAHSMGIDDESVITTSLLLGLKALEKEPEVKEREVDECSQCSKPCFKKQPETLIYVPSEKTKKIEEPN